MRANVMRGVALFVVAVALLPAWGEAQQKRPARSAPFDLGKMEYEAKCASCHGVKGKGNGPAARYMSGKVPDLTVLAKNNGGILPIENMNSIIVGASGAAGPHGSREMPVWGNVYRAEDMMQSPDNPYDPESYVRGRILVLIEYINRIQSK